MKFPETFLDDVKTRLPCSQVVGRKVQLRKAGREWRGLSPFNQEKTPSFFVNDAKEAWFDFSAGKSGDIFTFLMETEGLSFPEAVEKLAHEAGLSLPKQDAASEARDKQRQTARQGLEAEQARYVASLRTNKGAQAYLIERGITGEMAKHFGLGMAEIGRFSGRVTFPIHDIRGQLVGFGARALNGEQPKYLNTAETQTDGTPTGFQKGELVYNAHRARQPAHDGAPLAVVEGYTDVIQMTAAGFPAAVCTMGTAITAIQLRTLWRLSDTPVMMLDGDSAGRRAALKVAKLAFAELTPGRSLKFAFLPVGLDPDDLIKQRGPEAIALLLRSPLGLADAFWRLMTMGRSLASPDERAKLETELMEAFKPIGDGQLRRKYEQDARDRVFNAGRRRPVVRANGQSRHSTAPGAIRLLHGLAPSASFTLREAVIITSYAGDILMHAADPEGLDLRNLSARALSVIDKLTTIAFLPPGEQAHAMDGDDVSRDLHEAIDAAQAAGIQVAAGLQ